MNFEKLNELLDQKNYLEIKENLKNIQKADIADFLEELEPSNALIVFRLLPKVIAADVFSYLSRDNQIKFSELVNDKELASIISDLYFDDKIDYLEEMPANVVKKILVNSSETERKLINQFLKYPEDSAGSLMTIEFVDLKKEAYVRDAMGRLRRIAPNKETIYTCYVIDENRHLEGTVSLKDLVLASEDKQIKDIMYGEPIYVNTYNDQEYIAEIFKKYDLLAVPVVDKEDRLIGIITIDDIIDVIEQENTEDFYRMAAIERSDEEYINTSVFILARKRIMWLIFLMFSATLTGYIIRSFEATLAAVVSLAVFFPLIMGTGGNAGAQASTLVIRSLVLGEIEIKDIWKVIYKEFRVSLLVGGTLAFFNFLRIYYLERYSFALAFTVSFTMIFTIITAKVMGGILPLAAKKINVDPAIMASPFITTVVDAVSLIIYFYSAIWFMKL